MIPAHAQWTVLPVTRIITEIEKRKSPDEYAVFVDGEYAFKVDAELLFRLGLKVGEVIDPATEAKVLRRRRSSARPRAGPSASSAFAPDRRGDRATAWRVRLRSESRRGGRRLAATPGLPG